MRRRAEAGFTLVELLIVVAILGILAAILIPNFIRSRGAAQLAACQVDLRNIATAMDLYYNENDIYPAMGTWESELTSGGYIRSVPRSPVDGAPFGFVTNAGRTNYVLSDGPNKYIMAGISGYVVYTATGGLEVGLPSVPTP